MSQTTTRRLCGAFSLLRGANVEDTRCPASTRIDPRQRLAAGLRRGTDPPAHPHERYAQTPMVRQA
jgi:hypothetical protein